MRIAVFHNLPTGGAKRILHGFVRYLISSGHTVDAFVPSTAREDFLPLKDAGAKVAMFPVEKTLSGRLYSFAKYLPPTDVSLRDLEKTEMEIAETVDKQGYDVVLSEQDRFTMSPFFLKYVHTPTVYFCQQPSRFNEFILQNVARAAGRRDNIGTVRRWARHQFAKRLPRIDKENASYAKYVLVNSSFSRESVLRSYGIDSRVSHLGVDTTIFKPSASSRESFVLSVGECAPKKGFDFIIRSLALIPEARRPKLVLVCNSFDPGWREYLEQLAAESSVKLEFRSLVKDEELVELYNRAAIVVYAPYLEPFGLVPLEAMACGTPVVAVREGGVRESVVDGETGLLTDRDERAFSDALSNMLLDAKRRKAFGRKAIEVVHNYWTMEHAGERLLEHLNRVRASR